MLSGEYNLKKAAAKILEMGPPTLVIKRGEYGAILWRRDGHFMAPGYLLRDVFDPTGAGDSFAGGFFGYIASQPALTPAVFRRAMFYGSVMGSFAVERFGTERLQQLDPKEIEERFALFRQLSHLD